MQSKNNNLQSSNVNLEYAFNPALRTHYGDKHFSLKISRNTLIAFIISIIIHALIFFVVPKIEFDEPAKVSARAMEVSLAPIRVPTKVEEPQQAELPKPKVNPPPVKKPTPKSAQPNIITSPQQDKKPVFELPETPKPELDTRPLKEVTPKEPPIEKQYTDMASYVKAQQAKRVDAEAMAAQANAEAVARERGPTEAQIRDERIKRNLKYGTNGIFEIKSCCGRHASFSFRGWTNDYSTAKQQYFEVEASGGQDVRLLMVRRMIDLIREHYDGNFNWESYRLRRSVVLSAKLEDSAGLEDFLMKEFFGNNYKAQY
jgi:outer membrane biosynthesis protein TonB